MRTLKNNLPEWFPVVALILCSVHASVPHGSGGPPSTDGCISPCSRLLHSQERDSVGIRQKSIKVPDAQFVFLSQPLCFEPELALLKLLLNPIALVAKICCWKIWFLQSSKLWYFFHDRFTCICEAHRSFHKPTDWYLATIWASSPILSRIYLFFPPNLSWTWAWVFHKENCCIEQSCKARRRATMINCMVPLGERFGLFKGK